MITRQTSAALQYLGLVGTAPSARRRPGRAAPARAVPGRTARRPAARPRAEGPRPTRPHPARPQPPRRQPARGRPTRRRPSRTPEQVMRSSLGWLGLAETPVVVTGHPRMRERVLQTLRQRRRRDQLVTVSLGALLAIVLLGIGIVRSPLLAVDRVSLVGVSQVQQQALTGLLAVDEGANVLDVDLGVLEEQAESLPWVAVATARRRLPSTIEVRVAVNRPVASAVVGEVRYLLDAEGVAVESMPADAGGGISTRGAVADLPTIVLTDPPLVGEPQADPQVRDLAVVAASMPKALQEWITGYRAAGTDEVDALLTVPTPGGPVEFVAHLGRAEQVRVKAASLAALVDETIGRGLRPRSVDVRIPDRPVVLS